MSICHNVGARLCTSEELRKDCTRGTGCGHDGDLVWTQDACGTGAVKTSAPSQKTVNTPPPIQKTVSSPAETAENGYKRLGTGYCNSGYYAGWEKQDATLEKCKAKCSSEDKCVAFSLKEGHTCSRYNKKAGECSNRKHGHGDHVSYLKTSVSTTSTNAAGAVPVTGRFAQVKHKSVCGRGTGNTCKEKNTCADGSDKHEVRCCAEKKPKTGRWFWKRKCGIYAASEVPKCQDAKSFAEAKKICKDIGARLCTADELKKDCGKWTGCMHDMDLIWTGDTC